MSTSSYRTLHCEPKDQVLAVFVNRPKKLNALDKTVLSELRDCVEQAPPSVRAMLISGSGGKAFACGADIEEMKGLSALEAQRFSQSGHDLGKSMNDANFPIIAVVNGFALGGGLELALFCDFIIASSTAKFGMPEVKLGLIPGFGGTQRLSRRIGIARARQLIYTGELIDAATAERWGLVNEVVEASELDQRADALATSIAQFSPLAIRMAKHVLNDAQDMPPCPAGSLESSAFGSLFSSADAREGIDAFLSKRRPKFEGR